MSESIPSDTYDVLVVGGGVAGLSAAVYTARAGLDTLVVNAGEPILKRNVHLENVPGFPAGVNSRLFLEMLSEQATRNGVTLTAGQVTALERAEGGSEDDESQLFEATVELDAGADGDKTVGAEMDDARAVDDETRSIRAEFVVAASWSDASYLDPLGVDLRDAGSKQYIRDDGQGRTNVEGVYAAGRLAERYHQAAVAAGHGTQVAITLIHDADVPFYHDWVVPEGYFTDRGREVPPGCEEIDAAEQQAREEESIDVMRNYFSAPHDEQQRTHSSLVDDDLGRLPEDEWGDDD